MFIAQAPTSNSIISSISPSTIAEGVSTDITLSGTTATGDKVIWATSCAGAIPNKDLTMGRDMSTSFTVSPAGNYKLCYRASGKMDSVEQNDITLIVQAVVCGSMLYMSFDLTGHTSKLDYLSLASLPTSHLRRLSLALESRHVLLPFLLNTLFWHFVAVIPSTGQIRLIL
jgi:hypothetical protein